MNISTTYLKTKYMQRFYYLGSGGGGGGLPPNASSVYYLMTIIMKCSNCKTVATDVIFKLGGKSSQPFLTCSPAVPVFSL